MATRTETITSGPAEAFAGLLGVPLPDLDGGEPLPLLWHWLYLLERPAQAALGEDGHPSRGAVPAPPGPHLRRMFAGGRVTQGPGALRTGAPATRRTWTANSTEKHGRSGKLIFVKVQSEISQDGKLVIAEEQDIVYRSRETVPWVPPEPERSVVSLERNEWLVEVDPVVLFRFSALTYNSHRIHYDREYARDAEGYPGLVVHGPLQALLMTELARRATILPTRCQYSYRLTSPLFERQGVIVSATNNGATSRTLVRASSGRQTAQGTIEAARWPADAAQGASVP